MPVIDGGVIPGMSVQKDGRVLGRGLYLERAIALALRHDAEIWGYGKTTCDNFPNAAFRSVMVAYARNGRLLKTNEWIAAWDEPFSRPKPMRRRSLEQRLRGRWG